MEAGESSCSCANCGTVCPGLFRGCPDVWAAGSTEFTPQGPRPSAAVLVASGDVPASVPASVSASVNPSSSGGGAPWEAAPPVPVAAGPGEPISEFWGVPITPRGDPGRPASSPPVDAPSVPTGPPGRSPGPPTPPTPPQPPQPPADKVATEPAGGPGRRHRRPSRRPGVGPGERRHPAPGPRVGGGRGAGQRSRHAGRQRPDRGAGRSGGGRRGARRRCHRRGHDQGGGVPVAGDRGPRLGHGPHHRAARRHRQGAVRPLRPGGRPAGDPRAAAGRQRRHHP